ncbi:MAG: ATP synthase F1 subunit delta [Litorilinea sp.]
MSNRSAQAQSYAQAAFQALLEQWHTALDEVLTALQGDQKVFNVVMDSSKDFAEREKALMSVVPKGTPPELANMLKLMLQEGDLELASEVSQALVRLGSGQKVPTRADVVSAAELSDAEQESLRAMLTKEYGSDLIFSFRVDPALLGGLRVRVGDRLIDTSIASRLSALRESLSTAAR